MLEGFPRTADEARYLADMGLFPDAALIMAVSDGDVIGRLLPPKLDKWRVKRDKRLAKKAKKREKAKKKRVREWDVFVGYHLKKNFNLLSPFSVSFSFCVSLPFLSVCLCLSYSLFLTNSVSLFLCAPTDVGQEEVG